MAIPHNGRSRIRRLPEPWRRRLLLPAYRISAAARYADISTQTVTWWHYGGGQLGPALPERARRRPLSYLELVEVAFVATFRALGVSLQRIRKARQYAAQTFGAEYPFAELRFKTEGAHMLMDYLEFVPDDGKELENLLLFADKTGQLGWRDMVADRFLQFEYEGLDLAVVWYPAGRESPVAIDPRLAFGAPTVDGLPTWVAKGRWQARESPEEIAEDFGVETSKVIAALAFEGVDLSAAA